MTVLTNLESEQAEPLSGSLGPGAMLSKERQAQGLDQSRVAAQLHLSERMIKALEGDDFATLPGPVFAQGYLRNYARLLGLSEERVLAAYHRLCPPAEHGQVTAAASGAVVREVRSSHLGVQLMTWAIVLGLITLLVIWWQGRLQWQSEPQVEQTATLDGVASLAEPDTSPFVTPPAAADQVTLPTSPASLTQGDGLGASAPPGEMDELPPAAAKSEPVSEPPPPPAVAQTPPPPVAKPVPEPAPAVVAVPGTAPATQKSATDRLVAKVPQAQAPGTGQMVFEFSDRCWAEVRDATGKAQIIGEMGPGAVRSVATNLGPFKIVLGNVKAVRMSVDGKPYDVASRTRGVVARLNLDPKQL